MVIGVVDILRKPTWAWKAAGEPRLAVPAARDRRPGRGPRHLSRRGPPRGDRRHLHRPGRHPPVRAVRRPGRDGRRATPPSRRPVAAHHPGQLRRARGAAPPDHPATEVPRRRRRHRRHGSPTSPTAPEPVPSRGSSTTPTLLPVGEAATFFEREPCAPGPSPPRSSTTPHRARPPHPRRRRPPVQPTPAAASLEEGPLDGRGRRRARPRRWCGPAGPASAPAGTGGAVPARP